MAKAEPIKSKADLQVFKSTIAEMFSYKHFALVHFGFNTALRISDIVCRRWDELIDKDGQFVEILTIKEVKTQKNKTIALSNHVIKILKNLRKLYPDDEYLFQTHSKRRSKMPYWNEKSVYGFMRKAAQELNFDINIGTNTMRSSFEYHLAKKTNPWIAQIFLNCDVTNNLTPAVKKEIIKVYNTLDL